MRFYFSYPSDQHYVMAFTGAPASFPVMERDIELHQYLQWSDYIDSEAEAYLTYEGIERPYVGLHLRNGVDWVGTTYDGASLAYSFAKILGYFR